MCRQVHPVSLGLFNFVNAWSMMFWPLMLADRKGAAVKYRFPLWLGTQVRPLFLSNSDMIFYACDRAIGIISGAIGSCNAQQTKVAEHKCHPCTCTVPFAHETFLVCT